MMQLKSNKNIVHRLALGVLPILLLLASCARSGEYADPEVVARAFWTAVQNYDAKSAVKHIHPDSRKYLGKMLERDIESRLIPPLPEVLEFEIRVDGDTAEAVILNSGRLSCDLVKEKGRWWVK